MITRSNIIARLNEFCIDANNPLGNASSIPTDGSNLSSIVEIGFKNYRNTFTQSTSAVQPVYKHNIINGNNAIQFNGSTTYMLCPYDAVKNGYYGPQTLTILWMTDQASATNNSLLGRNSFTDGFSIGQFEDTYMYTVNGDIEITATAGQFTANVWQVCSIRVNVDNSVDFFKNGVFVNNSASDPMAVDVSDLILGGFSDTLTGFNWTKFINLLGWSWRPQTNAEIIAQHNYGLGKLGI